MANGTGYRGMRDTTERGLRCQHWQATTPHDHRCPGRCGVMGKGWGWCISGEWFGESMGRWEMG